MFAALASNDVDAVASTIVTDRLRRLGHGVLLLAGAATYVVAKSVASGGQVTLLNVEFLLIGLLPFLIAGWASPPGAPMRVFPQVWVAALISYIVLSSIGFFEKVRVAALAPNGLDTLPIHFATCTLISVVLGLSAILTFTWSAAPKMPMRKPVFVAQLFSASVLMFAVLVFLIPA